MEYLFLYGPMDGETVDVGPRMEQITVLPDQGFEAVSIPDHEAVHYRHIKQVAYQRVELYDGFRHFVYVPIGCNESVLGRLIELASKTETKEH